MCKTAMTLLLEYQFHTDLQTYGAGGNMEKKVGGPRAKQERGLGLFGVFFNTFVILSVESNKSSKGKKYLLVSLRDLNMAG